MMICACLRYEQIELARRIVRRPRAMKARRLLPRAIDGPLGRPVEQQMPDGDPPRVRLLLLRCTIDSAASAEALTVFGSLVAALSKRAHTGQTMRRVGGPRPCSHGA